MITKIKQPDDPRRCQAVNNLGQCENVAMEGSTYCEAHGGNKAVQVAEKKSLRNYRLTKFNARLQALGDSPEIKSLRDEVAILRMLMEERLNQCEDTQDLIYQSGPISDLVTKIERVVISCHKLENSMGALLDRPAIMQFGTSLINLISEEIKDEEVLMRISQKILEVIANAQASTLTT